MSFHCTDCTNYCGGSRPVGECLLLLYLVVARHDGPRCFSHSKKLAALASAPARSVSEDGRTAEAANSSLFEAANPPGVFHQRRCSTADESGLPENVN